MDAGKRGRGRGPARGRGGRGRGEPAKKPKSKEDLDKELDAYVLGDAKHAQSKLNSDLDDYFAQKGKKASGKAEGAKGEEEAAPEAS